ncbi:methylmalonyl-CoA epimerase [bacterium]|nr:methylmalonyl-CoA epimerase [bacterium]
MTHLNHIGIAVREPEALAGVLALLGFSNTHNEEVPDQGVRTHFFPVTNPGVGASQATQIELLEVLDPQGTVARFIEKRGPGVHHLSFEVNPGQLDPLCAKIQRAGLQLIYPAPRAGAHGMRVNFIHPKSAGGILLEIMEKSAP